MGRTISTEGAIAASEETQHVVRIRLPSMDSMLAGAIIAFAVIWRTWALMQWTFRGDDWTYVYNATKTPFLSFITTPYNGHLLTGQFVLVWLVSKVAPLDYAVAQAPLILMSGLAGILMWRFLRALFGERPANLIPLAVFMLCPLSVPPALWWAAALTIVPLQLFIVATLFAVLNYVRVPSTSRLVVVGLAYAGGLIFWQKGLLILPLAVMFVLLFLGQGRGRDRLRSVTARLWPLWAVVIGITVPYAAWYLSVARRAVSAHPTFLQIERLTTKTVGSTMIPTFLGGPWKASTKAFISPLPVIPRLVTWLIAAATVGVSLLLCRQAWRAWAMLVAYIAMSIAVVAVSRLPLVGSDSGLVSRYYADTVAVFAVALALAFMVPLERRDDPGWAPRVIVFDIQVWKIARLLRLPGRPASSEGIQQHGTARKVAIAAVVLYGLSALVTGFKMANLSRTESAKDWFANVLKGVAADPKAAVVDGHLPKRAAPPALEQSLMSRVLDPIAPDIRWNAPDEQPLIFDSGGNLRPVIVGRIASAPPGPVEGCGYPVGGEPVTATLNQHLFPWTWGIQLTYYTPRRHRGFVSADGDRQAVTFLPGLHPLILVHYGTVSSITVQSVGATICVTRIQAGLMRPS